MKNNEWDAESIGEQLGMEGVGSVVSKVEAYCDCEERRIALTNQPRILTLQQEGTILLEEETALRDRLRYAPPPGDLRIRRRKTVYYWTVAALLTLAAFVFSVLTFDPFRIGWKGYLYCLGIAVVTPFALDQILEKYNAGRMFKVAATTACLTALASLMLLAVVRGDLFAEQLKSTETSVIAFDDSPPQAPPQNNFYDSAIVLLRSAMLLLALAMELGAGLALHQAWTSSVGPSEDWDRLRARLVDVRGRMLSIAYEITALQNEPAVFAARFWRNFYRAMLTHSIRSAMTKLLVLLAAFCLLTHAAAFAQPTNLVVAVDLTFSVGSVGPDLKSEFKKNIDAVSTLLAMVPAKSHVTVIGITDASFAHPDILLSATIPEDPGYFNERLANARSQLVRAWKVRGASLRPQFHQTDILGALMVASQIFQQTTDPEHKFLILYSDMRQNTAELNLERLSKIDATQAVGTLASKKLITDLRGVDIDVCGADNDGKNVTYWNRLREFWIEYFGKCQATVGSYSALRDTPNLAR
jgi:hypothetical protein